MKIPGDLSEYDLDKPQNQITLTEEDGNRIILQVGMKNEYSGQYYMKKSEDDKDIYLVSAVSLEPFMGTSYEFAQAESFPAVTSATIKDVKVEKENGYQLSQDDDSLYWYVSDGKTSEQADTSKAGTVTSAIGSLTYGDFVDYNCTDQAKYGFDDPYAIITATYLAEEDAEADTDATGASESEDKTEIASEAEDSGEAEEKPQVEKQLVIYVGDEIDGNRYVKVNDSKQVYTIPETSLTDIVDKNISDFYSLTVNYLTVNNLDSLEVQSEDGAHTVQVTRETAKIQKTVRKKAPDPRKKRVPVTLGKLLQIQIKKMKMQRKILLMKRPGLQKRKKFPMLLMERKLRKQYLLLSITN